MSASEKMASKAIRVVLFNLDETGSEGAGALWNSCPIIGAAEVERVERRTYRKRRCKLAGRSVAQMLRREDNMNVNLCLNMKMNEDTNDITTLFIDYCDNVGTLLTRIFYP